MGDGSLSFVMKCALLSIALIFLMQIKVGHQTIEHKSLAFMQESAAVDGLRSVASGAVLVTERAYHWVESLFKDAKHESKKARRDYWDREAKKSSDSSEDESE